MCHRIVLNMCFCDPALHMNMMWMFDNSLAPVRIISCIAGCIEIGAWRYFGGQGKAQAPPYAIVRLALWPGWVARFRNVGCCGRVRFTFQQFCSRERCPARHTVWPTTLLMFSSPSGCVGPGGISAICTEPPFGREIRA